MSSVAVYATWTMIYRQNLIIPPTLIGKFFLFLSGQMERVIGAEFVMEVREIDIFIEVVKRIV